MKNTIKFFEAMRGIAIIAITVVLAILASCAFMSEFWDEAVAEGTARAREESPASQPSQQQPVQQQPTAQQPEQSAPTQQTYRIGDTGPGGGKVFYDKGSYSDGWRYLEVAPVNQSTSVTWSQSDADVPGATGTGIGTGRANTAAIIQSRPGENASNNAAIAAASYNGGGKNDWFLPSIDELAEIYKVRAQIGFSDSSNFWSSTQQAPAIVSAFTFSLGRSGGYGKTVYPFYVRAIRAF
jgi:hypothetical protein